MHYKFQLPIPSNHSRHSYYVPDYTKSHNILIISAKCGTNPTILDYDGHLQGTFNNIVITDCPPAQTSQAPTETGIVSYKT